MIASPKVEHCQNCHHSIKNEVDETPLNCPVCQNSLRKVGTKKIQLNLSMKGLLGIARCYHPLCFHFRQRVLSNSTEITLEIDSADEYLLSALQNMNLGDIQFSLLRHRYGLGTRFHTQVETGEILGIRQQRVSDIEIGLLRILAHPTRFGNLLGMLEFEKLDCLPASCAELFRRIWPFSNDVSDYWRMYFRDILD